MEELSHSPPPPPSPRPCHARLAQTDFHTSSSSLHPPMRPKKRKEKKAAAAKSSPYPLFLPPSLPASLRTGEASTHISSSSSMRPQLLTLTWGRGGRGSCSSVLPSSVFLTGARTEEELEGREEGVEFPVLPQART